MFLDALEGCGDGGEIGGLACGRQRFGAGDCIAHIYIGQTCRHNRVDHVVGEATDVFQ